MQPKTPLDLSAPESPQPHPTPTAAAKDTTPKPPINWMWVCRDVLLIFGMTFIGSKLVGFSAKGMDNQHMMEALSEANILFMTLGFFIVAFWVRQHRVRHFLWVAALLWVVGTLPNIIFFNASLPLLLLNWLASAPLIAFAMMVGGAAGSALFKPKKIKHAA